MTDNEKYAPPPPSALPDISALNLTSNPFAPRTSTPSNIAKAPSFNLPPPSQLPQLSNFPKPSDFSVPALPTSFAKPPEVRASTLPPTSHPGSQLTGRRSISPALIQSNHESPPTPPSPPPPTISTSIAPPIVQPTALSPVEKPSQGPPAQIDVDKPAINVQPVPTAPPVVKEEPKEDDKEGVFDWLTKQMHENAFFAKVAEKAKVGMETVLTTLDPGMRDFLSGDGVVEVYVGTEDPMTSAAVRSGFERSFHSVIVRGVPIPQADSRRLVHGIAEATAACTAQLTRLSASRLAAPSAPFVVFQPFTLDIGNEHFYALRLILRWRAEDSAAISQPIPIPQVIWDALQKQSKDIDLSIMELSRQVTGQPFVPFDPSELLTLPSAILAQKMRQKIAELTTTEEAKK